MSFVDRRVETRPTSGEAPFGLHEVFFSRTDGRGVIQAGNYVFRRVGAYDWEELIGAPHKLIRHPDMPRGVFHLFWETIQSGEFIGAYVKNKSKDGLYYWVFAVVAPCGDGYLSARIKPSSKIFDEVRGVYAQMLKLEKEEGLSPEDSAAFLLDWLNGHGYDSYHDFATQALSQELMSRDKGLGNTANPRVQELTGMLSNAEALAEETDGLIADFDAMHTIPHNLRVLASRIEPSGGPVTVLSQNYGSMSRQMSDWFGAHVMGENSNFAKIKSSVTDSLFIEGMGRILNDCDSQLQKERRGLGEVDMETERRILGELVTDQNKRAQSSMREVDDEAARITAACQIMHRHFLGLSSTRVLLKIESARLTDSGETLADIIDQLGGFQERISRRLDRIGKLSEDIRQPDQQSGGSRAS